MRGDREEESLGVEKTGGRRDNEDKTFHSFQIAQLRIRAPLQP